MTENTNTNENANAQANERPAIVINTQYIKDLSFEIPHAPEIFRKMNKQPEMKIDLNVTHKPLENNTHAVCLNVAVNGSIADEKLFILELSYEAVVSLNIPQEHVDPVLSIEIPRMMFPFVRNIITQSMLEGGLPPIMLNPIDFAAVYAASHQPAHKDA